MSVLHIDPVLSSVINPVTYIHLLTSNLQVSEVIYIAKDQIKKYFLKVT